MSRSIIIPAWNGARWISDCLQIVEQQRLADDELIVVDNGSTDGTAALVAREFPNAKLVRLERNFGFAAAVNRGLEIAQGDVLILVNQDVLLRDGCLAALLARTQVDGPAIVGCKLLYPDGQTIQHAGGIILWPRGDPDHRGHRQPDDGRWDEVMQVDYVTGAVYAFDRQVLDAIGLFDEGFFPAYYEEVDYCFRARAAGFPTIYEPQAVAIHHVSQSLGEQSDTYNRAMQRSRLRFVLKHRTPDQLMSEFFPAEREYLFAERPAYARQILAPIYLNVLTQMSDPTQQPLPPEIQAEVSNLYVLAHSASERPIHQAGDREMDNQPGSIELPILHEHKFQSSVPIIGPLIRWMRSSLYSLTAKWPMLVLITRQNQANQIIAGHLMRLERQLVEYNARLQDMDLRLQEYNSRLIDQDRDLAYLVKSFAELQIQHRQLVRSTHALTAAEPEQASGSRPAQNRRQ